MTESVLLLVMLSLSVCIFIFVSLSVTCWFQTCMITESDLNFSLLVPVVNTKPEVNSLNDFPHVIRGCPSGSQGRTCSIQSAVSLPHSSLPDLVSSVQSRLSHSKGTTLSDSNTVLVNSKLRKGIHW